MKYKEIVSCLSCGSSRISSQDGQAFQNCPSVGRFKYQALFVALLWNRYLHKRRQYKGLRLRTHSISFKQISLLHELHNIFLQLPHSVSDAIVYQAGLADEVAVALQALWVHEAIAYRQTLGKVGSLTENPLTQYMLYTNTHQTRQWVSRSRNNFSSWRDEICHKKTVKLWWNFNNLRIGIFLPNINPLHVPTKGTVPGAD